MSSTLCGRRGLPRLPRDHFCTPLTISLKGKPNGSARSKQPNVRSTARWLTDLQGQGWAELREDTFRLCVRQPVLMRGLVTAGPVMRRGASSV